MRMLYLSADPGVPVLGHKGASVHVREMVAAFEAAGVSVVVASPRISPEGEELESSSRLVGIDPILPKRHSTHASLRQVLDVQARQVEAIARDFGVDAIYERLSLFGESGIRAAAQLHLPHLVELNAPLCEEARRFRTLPHPEEAVRIENEVLAAADHIFVVSAALADWLADGGTARTRITVTANGIDPAKFAPRARRPAARAFTLGFAGGLKPWHGIEVLLRAFRQALAVVPELRLEIVGGGPDAAVVNGATLPDGRLVYHGQLTHRDAIRAMSAWDVGVAPFLQVPRFYFSPLKVVEYMAAGLCPVASDLGQIRDVLDEGSRGVLVEAGNADALAGALVRLSRDRAHAAALGARARAHALGTLTWRGNAERVLAVLHSRDDQLVA